MLQIISSFDLSMLHAIFAVRNPQILDVFVDITQLGNVIAVFLVGGVIALILTLHQRVAETIGLTVALLGTAAASSFLKDLFARPRPDIMYQAYPETGYAFPSEHTALATALCVFVVYLVYRLTRERAGAMGTIAPALAFCLGLIVISGVGFSRLYLGVHYLSDVVGGAVLGAALAVIGIMIERSLERFNVRQ
ncbi:phosphatase PAP2 family protein [Candidatus Kaiserbacteria bacterium]|nr:phosphatase PAP2 family protein [Candidatus Kaiserbacteria bacterium]